MSNYLTLKQDVTDWIDRDDLNARIPSFIRMALHRINRKLRIIDMEQLVSTPLSSINQYYELPARFISMRNIFIDTDPERKLVYVTPKQMALYRGDDNDPVPYAYTIVDGAVKLDKLSSSSNLLVMNFYQGYADFTADGDTNWLLTNAYDLMLYGSLVPAEGFLMTDERIPVWKTQFDEILEELNDLSDEGRFSGDDLRIRAV